MFRIRCLLKTECSKLLEDLILSVIVSDPVFRFEMLTLNYWVCRVTVLVYFLPEIYGNLIMWAIIGVESKCLL